MLFDDFGTYVYTNWFGERKMLIVKFQGGLGNQIFQYAFYEYLKLNNQEVYADISDYKIHSHHYGYEIEKVFQCEIEKAEKKQIRSLAIKHNSFVVRALKKGLDIRVCKENEFYELYRNMIVEPISIGRDVYFSGYWQNMQYIKAVSEVLKKKLKFRKEIQGKNLECYEFFQGMDTVSVHVRRTDYLKNGNLGGICNKEYYVRAMNYMKARFPEAKFLFFSDDIEWCRVEFGNFANNYFVDWNIGEKSFMDMQLMSLCKNNIIANSSFSWWGAWLNNNKEKVVVIPKKWENFSDSTLMWPGWIEM